MSFPLETRGPLRGRYRSDRVCRSPKICARSASQVMRQPVAKGLVPLRDQRGQKRESKDESLGGTGALRAAPKERATVQRTTRFSAGRSS